MGGGVTALSKLPKHLVMYVNAISPNINSTD